MSGKKSASYGPQNQSTLVAGKKRVRSTSVCVWLSPDEQAKIRERMADVGIRNLSAYMRKMALNGYVLHVDLAPVKEIVSLQRRCANNLNQIAVLANTYGGVYPDEIKALQKDYADLWGPQTGKPLDTVSRGFRRVWGHPNKHFRKAKIASVIHLPCLPFVRSPRIA